MPLQMNGGLFVGRTLEEQKKESARSAKARDKILTDKAAADAATAALKASTDISTNAASNATELAKQGLSNQGNLSAQALQNTGSIQTQKVKNTGDLNVQGLRGIQESGIKASEQAFLAEQEALKATQDTKARRENLSGQMYVAGLSGTGVGTIASTPPQVPLSFNDAEINVKPVKETNPWRHVSEAQPGLGGQPGVPATVIEPDGKGGYVSRGITSAATGAVPSQEEINFMVRNKNNEEYKKRYLATYGSLPF